MRTDASVSRVYVLLPPSETKSAGGHGGPLDLAGLSFPGLSPYRDRMIDAVGSLAADLPAARAALRVSASLDGEIALNAALSTSPTSPALSRYTGVLFAALNTPSLSPAETARAHQRILITSALFGLLTGGDRIPAYRLSAGSRVPGLPTMASFWREPMADALGGVVGPVLDLRSGAYAAFAPLPQAFAVRVVTMTRSGQVKPVSHENKAIKGALARLVATTRGNIDDMPKLLALAYRGGLALKRTGPRSLDLFAPPIPE